MTARIDPLDLAVSTVLRGHQGQKNVTNVHLAATTGIHPRTLIRILEGHRAATVGELRLLAGVLGSTASEIAVEAERLIENA
ncbi:helix-turn-helix domain-containing protein [Cryobacterium psychrophilum]|nr:helix-turn-helix transcriptional regulator [Cryobacterium psychrophilum]TDW30983.1 helix-turn-helix protein [Cryobacterium psychrophilum]